MGRPWVIDMITILINILDAAAANFFLRVRQSKHHLEGPIQEEQADDSRAD